MFTVLIVVNCWVGNMKKLMRKVRSTKKGNSYLKSRILSRKTGNTHGLVVLGSLKIPQAWFFGGVNVSMHPCVIVHKFLSIELLFVSVFHNKCGKSVLKTVDFSVNKLVGTAHVLVISYRFTDGCYGRILSLLSHRPWI